MSQDSVNSKDNSDSSIKDNFLTALHKLKFEKTSNSDFESVQIERRCLAAKYIGAKKL